MDPDPNPGAATDAEPAPAAGGKRRRFTLRQEGPGEPPVPSLFRASGAAPPPGPVPVSGPVPIPPGPGSYAEFVVRGEGGTGKVPPGPLRTHGEQNRDRDRDQNRDRDREQNRDQDQNQNRDRDPGATGTAPSGPLPTPGDRDQDRDQNQAEDQNQAREVPALPVVKPGTKSSSIIVSPRQRGNPVLKFIRNVPWEFGDVVPDYVLGQSSCALFLSLRYHHLNPEYIHERLRALGRSFGLQVLLLQVDVRDPQQSLKDLAKVCLLTDCTLLLAWSAEEAARYLETFKSYEQKPPDLLRERLEHGFLPRVTECLTSVKSVNKTDALSLLGTFGSLVALARASREDLSLCPGVGPQKAKRLFDVLHQPFLKGPR